MMMKSLSLILLLIFLNINHVDSAGGLAEMNSLTGDAPYMGWGNQEQAPEFFGASLMKKYGANVFNTPYNDYAARYGAAMNYYNRAYPSYRYGYGSPYPGMYSGHNYGGPRYSPTNYASGVAVENGDQVIPPSVPTEVVPRGPPGTNSGLNDAFGGGSYQGHGNEWVKSAKS